MTNTINKEIEVHAFYFRQGTSMQTYPKEISFAGQQVRFAEGLRVLIHKGKETIKLFDMSDGQQMFHLKNQANNWVLLGISPLQNG